MLIEKKQTYTLDSIVFSTIINDWFFGGSILFTFPSAGEKTLEIYGYDNKNRTDVFLGLFDIPDGTGIYIFSKSDVRFRSLSIVIRSPFRMDQVSYLITSNFDRLNNSETSNNKIKVIDSDVYYSDIVYTQRSIQFRIPKELKEIAQTLFGGNGSSNKVYLDGQSTHATGVSPFEEYDNYNWSLVVNFIEVINV